MKSLLLVLAMMVGIGAQATDIEVTPIELGKEYSGKPFADAHFSFTAPQDGKLVLKSTRGDNPTLYTDETFATVSDVEMPFSYVSGGKENEMLVVKGTTYWFAYKFPINDWAFTARMDDASVLTMEYAKPAPDQVFPLANGGFLEIHFNTAIQATTAIVQTGTATAELTPMAYGRDLGLELKNILFPWMQNGTMKAGDTFTVTITGIQSTQNGTLYNGDGTLVLSYTASAKPAEVVKSTLPEKFISYWPATAQDGVVVLEYDMELSTEKQPVASVSFGSAEVEGDYYEEALPAVVSGKTLTVDFRGKVRIPSEMVASGTNYEHMLLRVNNICSADGNYVYSEGQGTFGSFQHSFPYEQIAYDLTSEFLPASGASLAGVGSVELWLSNPDAVSFDGVSVTFQKADGTRDFVDYTLEQCNYKNEGADGITMNVPITEEMQVASNVTITLLNMVSNDGIEREIQAVYNVKQVLEPKTIEPANNSQVECLDHIDFFFADSVALTAVYGPFPVTDATGRTVVCEAGFVIPTDGRTYHYNQFVSLEKPITEPGIYKMVIPAGCFTNVQGHTNEEITLTYEVKAKAGTFTFTPANGSTVNSLKEIIVEYTDVLMPSWNGVATLVNASGDIVATADVDHYIPADKQQDWDNYQYEPTGVRLTLNTEITAPGVYTLRLPAGYLNCGAAYESSPELTATFTVAATDAIASVVGQGTSRFTVFTLDGRRLPIIAKSQLRQLKPGIYMINGKKVVLTD